MLLLVLPKLSAQINEVVVSGGYCSADYDYQKGQDEE